MMLLSKKAEEIQIDFIPSKTIRGISQLLFKNTDSNVMELKSLVIKDVKENEFGSFDIFRKLSTNEQYSRPLQLNVEEFSGDLFAKIIFVINNTERYQIFRFNKQG